MKPKSSLSPVATPSILSPAKRNPASSLPKNVLPSVSSPSIIVNPSSALVGDNLEKPINKQEQFKSEGGSDMNTPGNSSFPPVHVSGSAQDELFSVLFESYKAALKSNKDSMPLPKATNLATAKNAPIILKPFEKEQLKQSK